MSDLKGIYKQKDKFIVTDLEYLGSRLLGPGEIVDEYYKDNTSIYLSLKLVDDDYLECKVYATCNNIKNNRAVKYVRDITPMEYLLGAVEIDNRFYDIPIT